MLIKYLDNNDGQELGTSEVKFMPHVGDAVSLGGEQTYKIANVIRNDVDQMAEIYLER